MKRNKKKVKRDILLLYFRRRRIRDALMKRWWELEAKRKELYKLVEYAKIQSRYCVNLDCHRIVGRYLRELEQEELRTCRLQIKYDIWASRLGYWIDLYETALNSRQIPQRTGARGTTYLQTSDQIRHLGFQTRLLDRPL